MANPKARSRKYQHALLLNSVLIIAVVLRFYNLPYAPHWFTDEATHLEIARHLNSGAVRYFAINESFLLFARLPAFEWLLAAILRLGIESIFAVRGLSALLGCLSIWLVYRLMRGFTGASPALVAAAILAVYPQAVLYSRFGFSYSLAAVLILVILYGFVYPERWWLSGVGLGIALISEVWTLTIIAPCIVYLAWQNRPKFLPTFTLAAIPLATYIVWMSIKTRDAFLFDALYTFSRLGGNTFTEQLNTLSNNLLKLAATEPLFVLGCLGIFLLPSKLHVVTILFLFFPILSLGRTVALYSLSSYYMIPLWPLLAIGAAGWFVFIQARMATRKQTLRLITIVLGATIILAAGAVFRQIEQGFQTDIEPFLVDGKSAEAAANFVNSRLNSAEITIASPTIGFLIDENVADFQMVPAHTGVETPHLPANLPHERFEFVPTYKSARYVIIDPLWRNWAAVHVPETQGQILEIEQNWTLRFEQDSVRVYENPSSTRR